MSRGGEGSFHSLSSPESADTDHLVEEKGGGKMKIACSSILVTTGYRSVKKFFTNLIDHHLNKPRIRFGNYKREKISRGSNPSFRTMKTSGRHPFHGLNTFRRRPVTAVHSSSHSPMNAFTLACEASLFRRQFIPIWDRRPLK